MSSSSYNKHAQLQQPRKKKKKSACITYRNNCTQQRSDLYKNSLADAWLFHVLPSANDSVPHLFDNADNLLLRFNGLPSSAALMIRVLICQCHSENAKWRSEKRRMDDHEREERELQHTGVGFA